MKYISANESQSKPPEEYQVLQINRKGKVAQ